LRRPSLPLLGFRGGSAPLFAPLPLQAFNPHRPLPPPSISAETSPGRPPTATQPACSVKTAPAAVAADSLDANQSVFKQQGDYENNPSRPCSPIESQAASHNSSITPLESTSIDTTISEKETVYETAARLLFMAVRWTKNLASFASLPFKDQVLLLEDSWCELFLLCSIQWCLPLAAPSLFSEVELPSLPANLASSLHTLNLIFLRYRQLNVDPAEFACLKAVILFKPEIFGVEDNSEVENLQDQSLTMLQHHVNSGGLAGLAGSGSSLQPITPTPRQGTRFARLLLALASLQKIPSADIEKIYFEKTIGSTPMEKLLGDMFKN